MINAGSWDREGGEDSWEGEGGGSQQEEGQEGGQVEKPVDHHKIHFNHKLIQNETFPQYFHVLIFQKLCLLLILLKMLRWRRRR